MEKQARQVMSRRLQTEDLDVEHVRDPGHRQPVGHPIAPERLHDGLRRDPSTDRRVLRDMVGIVDVEEAGLEHPRVDGERDSEKPERSLNVIGSFFADGLDETGTGF